MTAAIRVAILGRTGYSATGAASVAAELFAAHSWGDRTRVTRASQWRKWEAFCEDDERSPFPASEGDVLAYIGYLKMKGLIAAASLPQYLTAISRYHEFAGMPSPTRTPLVRAIASAYRRSMDVPDAAWRARIGLPAAAVRGVLQAGLSSATPAVVRDCALVVMMFLTGCRGSTVAQMGPSDVGLADGVITARLVHRKGKRTRNPLVLSYPLNREAGAQNHSPFALLRRWDDILPVVDAYFALAEEDALTTGAVAHSLASTLAAAGVVAPAGCTYTTHSIRIGVFNELLNFRFPTPWIMHHAGWESDKMMQVYYDSHMCVTADSKYFFGHLLGPISGAGQSPAGPGSS